ncbi:MAG: ComEC/Rec2 family competence protein [Vampirovibrionales bacterium]
MKTWKYRPFLRTFFLLLPTLGVLMVTGYLIECGHLPFIPWWVPFFLLVGLVVALLLCLGVRYRYPYVVYGMTMVWLLLAGVYGGWWGYVRGLDAPSQAVLLQRPSLNEKPFSLKTMYRVDVTDDDTLPMVRGLFMEGMSCLTCHVAPLSAGLSFRQSSKGVLVTLTPLSTRSSEKAYAQVKAWVPRVALPCLKQSPYGMATFLPLPHAPSPAYGTFSPRVQALLRGGSVQSLVRWKPVHIQGFTQQHSLHTGGKEEPFLRIASFWREVSAIMAQKVQALRLAIERHYQALSAHGMPEWQQRFLQALVLGDKGAGLPWWLTQAYQKAGVSHWLAASGYNLTVAVGGSLLLLRFLGVSTGWLVWIGWFGIVVFGTLTAWPVSMIRAGSMLATLLGCFWLYRRLGWGVPSVARVFYAVVAMLSLLTPKLWLHVGFQLSVLATWGIVTLLPVLWRLTEPYLPKWQRWLLLPTVAAQLAVFPLLLGVFQQFHWASLPLNWLGAPLISVLTLASWGYTLFGACAYGLCWFGEALASGLGCQEVWHHVFHDLKLFSTPWLTLWVKCLGMSVAGLTWMVQTLPSALASVIPHVQWMQPFNSVQWAVWYVGLYGVTQWKEWWVMAQKRVLQTPWFVPSAFTYRHDLPTLLRYRPSWLWHTVVGLMLGFYALSALGQVTLNPHQALVFQYPQGTYQRYRLLPLVLTYTAVHSSQEKGLYFSSLPDTVFLILPPWHGHLSAEQYPWLFKRVFGLTRWPDKYRSIPWVMLTPHEPLVLKPSLRPSQRVWLQWNPQQALLHRCEWQVYRTNTLACTTQSF